MLLEYGAYVDPRRRDKWTPLHLTVHHGKLDEAMLLIENGANIEAHTTDGQTPLEIAVEKGKTFQIFHKIHVFHRELAIMPKNKFKPEILSLHIRLKKFN